MTPSTPSVPPRDLDDCSIAFLEFGPVRTCVEGLFLLALKAAGMEGDSEDMFLTLHDAIVPRLMELAVCEAENAEGLVTEAQALLERHAKRP